MSKLSIEGNIVGSIAEAVDYGKNNAATVEDALDALFEGAGGGGSSSDSDEISNADLAVLANSLVEKSGIDSAAYTAQYYADANNANIAVGSTFNPASLNGQIDYSVYHQCHFKLDIYEGEVLHYDGIGLSYAYGYVICDADNKVLALGEKRDNASGTFTAPANSRYCYISSAQSTNPRVWVVYTNRPHIKAKVEMLQAFGDSITCDNVISNFPIAYPRLIAEKLGAKLYRIAAGGAHITHLGANIYRSRCDADVVTIAYGTNDCKSIADGAALGSASSALEILPADGSLDDLSSSELNTLQSTRIGYYRWCLAVLLEKYLIKETSKIFCIGPWGSGITSGNIATALTNFRTELKNLVDGLGTDRVNYVNGAIIMPYFSQMYIDSDHPTEAGQIMIANGLYAYIAAELGVL